MDVRALKDESLIVPFLQQDRRWSAYSLADLEPPYRENARFIGAIDGSHLAALLLLYRLPGAIALHTTGALAAVAEIMRRSPNLPPRAFLLVPELHFPAIETRYHIADRWLMQRMVLEPDALTLPSSSPLPLFRLTESELPQLQQLYALWGDVFFDPLTLRSGVFHGAFDADRLVAVAGTHVVCPRFRVAAIGGVFTHPDYRGQGLARATTARVCETLTEQGIEIIVLNVRDGNLPALSAYRRLGFVHYLPYWEGHATLR